MQTYLDFEKGLAEIEGKAEELRALARKNSEMNVEEEAAGARPQGGLAARRPLPRARPLAEDAGGAASRSGRTARTISTALFSEWTPLGRGPEFADDHAVMGGLARFDGAAGGGDRP